MSASSSQNLSGSLKRVYSGDTAKKTKARKSAVQRKAAARGGY